MMKIGFSDQQVQDFERFSSSNNRSANFLRSDSNQFLFNYFPDRMIHPEATRSEIGRVRQRVLVRQGLDHITLQISQIVFFYSENKLTYVVDYTGKKYVAELNLVRLEKELDKSIFFRANRQYIINVNYIKSFRKYERVKLVVKMEPMELNERHSIIISQKKAPLFKKWIYGR